MPILGRKRPVLDGEEIIQLWLKLDSLSKVSRLFASEGRLNPSTNRPFTEGALNRAVHKFMVSFPDKARDYYDRAADIANVPRYTDEQWKLELLRKAMQLYANSRTGFFRWVVSQPNEWPRDFEPMYRDAYNAKPEDYDYFKQTTRRMPKRSGWLRDSEDIQE